MNTNPRAVDNISLWMYSIHINMQWNNGLDSLTRDTELPQKALWSLPN